MHCICISSLVFFFYRRRCKRTVFHRKKEVTYGYLGLIEIWLFQQTFMLTDRIILRASDWHPLGTEKVITLTTTITHWWYHLICDTKGLGGLYAVTWRYLFCILVILNRIRDTFHAFICNTLITEEERNAGWKYGPRTRTKTTGAMKMKYFKLYKTGKPNE